MQRKSVSDGRAHWSRYENLVATSFCPHEYHGLEDNKGRTRVNEGTEQEQSDI